MDNKKGTRRSPFILACLPCRLTVEVDLHDTLHVADGKREVHVLEVLEEVGFVLHEHSERLQSVVLAEEFFGREQIDDTIRNEVTLDRVDRLHTQESLGGKAIDPHFLSEVAADFRTRHLDEVVSCNVVHEHDTLGFSAVWLRRAEGNLEALDDLEGFSHVFTSNTTRDGNVLRKAEAVQCVSCVDGANDAVDPCHEA